MDQVSQSLTANLVDFHLGPEHANPRFVNDSCELLEATWGLYHPKKTLLGDPWVIQYTFLWTQTHSSSNFVYPNISKYNCFWMSTPSHKWQILRHWNPVLSTCADLNQGQSPLSPRYLTNKRIDRLPYLTYNMCNGEGHDFPIFQMNQHVLFKMHFRQVPASKPSSYNLLRSHTRAFNNPSTVSLLGA